MDSGSRGPAVLGETPYCLTCGKVVPKMPEETWEEWEALRYCDPTCQPKRLDRDELIAEVEFLVGSVGPQNLAHRLGYAIGSLARRLERSGRPDLAHRFDRIDSAARRQRRAA
jgi:hypothetical protein